MQLRPEWEGPPPPEAAVAVIGRRGTDLNPARLPDEGDRLLAYVWPTSRNGLPGWRPRWPSPPHDPPAVDRAGAADWIEAKLALEPEPGVTRVVMHSVAFQYFDADSQKRVTARIEAAGEQASAEAPLAWLRYEQEPGDRRRRSGSGPGPAASNCSPGRIRTAARCAGWAIISYINCCEAGIIASAPVRR